jgi:hypothetical protein
MKDRWDGWNGDNEKRVEQRRNSEQQRAADAASHARSDPIRNAAEAQAAHARLYTLTFTDLRSLYPQCLLPPEWLAPPADAGYVSNERGYVFFAMGVGFIVGLPICLIAGLACLQAWHSWSAVFARCQAHRSTAATVLVDDIEAARQQSVDDTANQMVIVFSLRLPFVFSLALHAYSIVTCSLWMTLPPSTHPLSTSIA